MADVHLGHLDGDGTVHARVGDVLVVSLPQNATTGYRWSITSYTEGMLLPDESDAPADPSPQGVGGTGDLAVLRFRVTAPGRGSFSVKLWRGHEPDEDVHRLMFSVEAADPGQ